MHSLIPATISAYLLVMGSVISLAIAVYSFVIIGSLIPLGVTYTRFRYVFCKIICYCCITPIINFWICNDHLIRIVGGHILIGCNASLKRVRCFVPCWTNVFIINYFYSTLIGNIVAAANTTSTVVFMNVIIIAAADVVFFICVCVFRSSRPL